MNLGIGIPDGVASVAAEEGMLGKMLSEDFVGWYWISCCLPTLLCLYKEYVTLSTEPGTYACPWNVSPACSRDPANILASLPCEGVFGGLPASGHSFGPAYNATSLMEMNQMFDFYDGGGLDMTFLGTWLYSARRLLETVLLPSDPCHCPCWP